MEWYLLKSAVCLGLFYLFYKALLENSSMHTFKRFYLMGGLIFSFLIPLVTFTTYVEIPLIETPVYTATTSHEITPISSENTINYIPYALWSLYFLGVGIFGIRFGLNLHHIIKKIKKNTRIVKNGLYHVLLSEEVAPHTFFNNIFFNRQRYETGALPKEVFWHEETHAKQKHSVDIILMELLQIIFWFNPLMYLLKNAIKLNHEFLADQAVLNRQVPATQYQQLVLTFSSNVRTPSMAHSINYLSIKKRFTVMKNQTSKKTVWFRSLLVLPLVVLVFYGFSSSKTITTLQPQTTQVFSQETATPQQIITFNSMAKYWNTRFEEYPTARTMPLSELEKLEDIYRNMSPLQKQGAQPFPECIPKNNEDYTKEYLKGAANNDEKTFVLMITVNEIMFNGKATVLENLKSDLDAYTKNWEETDYTDANPSILISSSSPTFIQKVNIEFKKSHFSKANSGMSIQVPIQVKRSLDNDATPEQIAEYNKLAKKYNTMPQDNMRINGKELTRMQYIYDLMSAKQRENAVPFPNIPPPPPAPDAPKAPKVKKGVDYGDSDIPPPPPTPDAPESPLDHVISMAKKGATFYHDDKKITSDKAIELLKKNKNLNIESKNTNSGIPTVRISKTPITIEKNSPFIMTVVDMPLFGPQPNIEDPKILLDLMIKNGAKIFFEGKEISNEKAFKILNKEKSIQIKTVDTPHDIPSVLLGSEYGC